MEKKYNNSDESEKSSMKANRHIIKVMAIISLRLSLGMGISVFSACITKVPTEPGNGTFVRNNINIVYVCDLHFANTTDM